jgi:uncharacterized membrane protein
MAGQGLRRYHSPAHGVVDFAGEPFEREEGSVSSSARWVVCAVLAVLGVIALIYAVIYVSVPIHSLPGFVPGKRAVDGHYHKRALLVAVIGIVLLAISVFVGLGARRSAAQVGSTPPADPSAGGATAV